MADLRLRFERLDELAAPNLWPEVERRAELLPTMGTAALQPRIRWGTTAPPGREGFGGRRYSPVPVLLVVALLIIAMLAALTVVGGWRWWERPGPLVQPPLGPVVALEPDGDCPGAVAIDGPAPPYAGWPVGSQPGFFASTQPGRITALWHDRRNLPQQPVGFTDPPISNVVLVELDPVGQTMCRVGVVRTEQSGLLSEANLPDSAWTGNGEVFAFYHGGVDAPKGCCAPGQLTLWWPGGRADPPVAFDTDAGSVAWSNSGRHFAVSWGNATQTWADPQPSTVSVFSADGTGPRDLRFDCGLCIIVGGSFSPDDSRVAVTYWRVTSDDTADELIGVADTATGSGVVLDVGLTKLHILGWQDDRTILAVDDGRRVVAIPVDAPSQFRDVARIPEQISQDVWGGEWSPDRSRVAYTHPNTDQPDQGAILSTDIYVLDVASGTTRHINREFTNLAFPHELVWAPDNRTFAYGVWNDAFDDRAGITMKVADALEGTPVPIAIGVTPVNWRPVWR